jgi:hypothetical protein
MHVSEIFRQILMNVNVVTLIFMIITIDWGSIPSRGNESIFIFTTASKPAQEPTQPSIQWVRGPFPQG